MTVRIMVVDDSEVVRVGLAAVLSQDPELVIVGEATTSTEAVRLAHELEPDLVVLDVRIPEEGGIEAGRQILEDLPSTRVLFHSAFADDELVRAAIMIGAHGYLLKEVDARSLVRSVKRVGAGESILDPRLRDSLVDWVTRNASPPDATGRQELAPQEQRIVALVAEGKTNKQIAAALNISPLTVKNYLHRIFEKVGIQRRSQAAALHIKREI